MHRTAFAVVAQWDAEAQVWVATSDDVPGLVTEADTLDALGKKLAVMVPELLDLNRHHLDDGDGDVPIELIARFSQRERCMA
jgi:hypothetical protein